MPYKKQQGQEDVNVFPDGCFLQAASDGGTTEGSGESGSQSGHRENCQKKHQPGDMAGNAGQVSRIERQSAVGDFGVHTKQGSARGIC